MTVQRHLPGRDYQSLKAATRRLVDKAGGPSAAADVTRTAHQHLSAYGSVNRDLAERFMPIDVAADLEAETGDPVVTRVLARLSGYLLVQAPRTDHLGSHLAKAVANALKETSEVFLAIAERSADGKICADDVKVIGREIDEALSKLAALKLQVEADGEVDE